jgi:hypothetical protein
MRRLLPLVLVLVGIGCAGPHSSGALWAQQNLEAERAAFRLGDARRAQLAQEFELSIADDSLSAEVQRIRAELQACPAPRAAFNPSEQDKLRDGIRLHVESGAARLAKLSDVAVADWFVRRASATGDSGFCARAAQALNGESADPPVRDVLNGIPTATVARFAAATPAVPDVATLSNYALGFVDVLTASAPLPQYLAVVYGGAVVDGAPTLSAESAAIKVDTQAAAYPEWEPDALYAALRGGSWP